MAQQQEDTGRTSRQTAWWQLVLVGIALATFAFNVLLPVAALVFAVAAVVGVVSAGAVLDRIGALAPGIFEGAAQLSLILLFLAAGLASLVTGWNWIRRLSGRTEPPPFLLRWPWFLLGALLVLTCRAVLPAGLGRSDLPVLPGALVIAAAIWGVLAVGYLLVRFSFGGLGLSWRIARASPFGAGMLTLGALAATAAMFMVTAVVKQLIQAQTRRLAAPSSVACNSLTMECSRQFLLASHDAAPSLQTTSLDSLEAPTADRVSQCLESQYQKQDMTAKAFNIARQWVGPTDARDLVHSLLLSICLRRKPPDDFEAFFIRSVGYFASRVSQRNLRSCPLEFAPEPVCSLRPDDQYVQSEERQALHRALCSLGEEHREVLLLRYFDELAEDAIASRLGISYPAARKRLQRAREKLEVEILQRCQ